MMTPTLVQCCLCRATTRLVAEGRLLCEGWVYWEDRSGRLPSTSAATTARSTSIARQAGMLVSCAALRAE